MTMNAPAPRPLLDALGGILAGIRFRPVIFEAMRGLTGAQLRRDVTSGLVVGVLALPLAIAFAIASGADPRAGLVTAAVAGFVAALLGGSRVQVTGPTGAFVVVLYAIVQDHGISKLFVAVALAGAILVIMGLLRAGDLIKYIPYPVTTGFTAGIAVIIFLGQIPHLLGLRLDSIGVVVPAGTFGKVFVVVEHVGRTQWVALALGASAVAVIMAGKRLAPSVPGPVVALVGLTLVALWGPLTAAERVGDLYSIAQGPPTFAWPEFSLATILEMLPSAFVIALLGAVESLLSAVVADGMTGTRHDSNQELMAQGAANLVVPLFGGIAATGAIARTATNVQNGGRTPIAGITHALVVLAVLVAAAPLAALVPMAVLAGILIVVAWNMSERHRFAQVLRMPAADAAVLLTTFGLTVLWDLTVAVGVGIVLAALLFIGRMGEVSHVRLSVPDEDVVHHQDALSGREVPPGVVVYSVDGPFFFGAATRFQEVLERIGKEPRVVIFRMRRVPFIDATGLMALSGVVEHLGRQGCQLVLSAPQSQPMDIFLRSGFAARLGDANLQPNIDAALARARQIVGSDAPTSVTS
jgi:SulP family sulfate permease